MTEGVNVKQFPRNLGFSCGFGMFDGSNVIVTTMALKLDFITLLEPLKTKPDTYNYCSSTQVILHVTSLAFYLQKLIITIRV